MEDLLTGRAGTRLAWSAVPFRVRSDIEARLASPVLSAHRAEMGFSPALAAELRLADGRRVFVKAIGPDDVSGAPGGAELYRREARNAARLPSEIPAPRLVMAWEVEDWVVLIFDLVVGRHPSLPWLNHELARVLEGLTRLSERLTPSPFDAPPVSAPGGEHWSHLLNAPSDLETLPGLDPWVSTHLEPLAELESGFAAASRGSTLLHTDIRADNLLLTEGGVVFLDWPHAEIGAAWVDLLYFLPSVAMQGGPEPAGVFWSHPLSKDASEGDVATVLAAVTGYLVHSATRPPPPGLPTLRRFQLEQAYPAVQWLRRMMP